MKCLKFAGLAITAAVVLFISLFFIPIAITAEENHLTQREFILHLADVMKLQIPKDAVIGDYIKAFEARGITIPGGYKPDEFITTKQMALMLIPGMGLDKNKFEKIKKRIGLSYKDKTIIVNITGDVKFKLKDSDIWEPAKPGIFLGIEDMIKTGIDSSAIIRLGEITLTKIKENTTITIYKLTKNPIIYMEKGDLILDTEGSSHASAHTVITPTTVAAVRGTIIEVMYKQISGEDATTRVIVAKGKTEVFNVSEYTLPEKIDMARKDKYPVKGIKLTEGNFVEKDKIYPLTDKSWEALRTEIAKAEVIADTDLLGTAAEEFLEEEKGITGDNYLKIDTLDRDINKTKTTTLTKK